MYVLKPWTDKTLTLIISKLSQQNGAYKWKDGLADLYQTLKSLLIAYNLYNIYIAKFILLIIPLVE